MNFFLLFFRHAVFSALISDILCPVMTKQIVFFLLPSIADQSVKFPFSQLLETLLKLITKADDQGGPTARSPPHPGYCMEYWHLLIHIKVCSPDCLLCLVVKSHKFIVLNYNLSNHLLFCHQDQLQLCL